MKIKKKVYLIGTVHNDFKGYERLTHILNGISPDAIGIETDEKGREYFESGKYLERLCVQKTPNIQAFYNSLDERRKKHFEFQMIELPKAYFFFEMRAAYEYSKNNNAVIFCMEGGRLETSDENNNILGDAEYANSHFRAQVFDSLDTEPERLIPGQQRETDHHYEEIEASAINLIRTRRALSAGLYKNLTLEEQVRLKDTYNEGREVIMEQRIREQFSKSQKVVAIMGLGHLPLMYDRLRNICPVAMTLLGKRYNF